MSKFFESQKVFWMLFALCCGTRIYMFFSTYVIARDSVLYMGMSDLFQQGQFLEALKYITPPFYPLLLAAMKIVIGDPEIAGKMVSFITGVCTFFPLYYLGKKIFERHIVFLGLFLFSIHPYLVRYSAEVLSESTFIFLSVTGMWLFWKGLDERRHIYCLVSGAILGLSCLTRAQGLIWAGVLMTVPIIFYFLRRRKEIYQGKEWISSLLAIVGFFIVIIPYAYFLKGLTGEWTIRQSGAYALLMGTGSSQQQGLWGSITTLLGHPLLLLKKMGWNIGRLVLLLPETIHYPFLFLLVVGLVAWRQTERYSRGELYLAIICLVYILGHCLLYLKVRYLLPIVPFALFWAGRGFWVTMAWVQRFFARYIPKVKAKHRALVVTSFFLIVFTAVTTLPKTLLPQRLDKLDREEIGHRIAASFQGRPAIIASDPRIGFYAGGVVVEMKKVKTFKELLECARANKVDIVVMGKEALYTEGELGDLTRDFFAHPDHPGLQLLFIYPSSDQTSSPPFYVYRFLGEKRPENQQYPPTKTDQ
jgi:4-amino-4-deoxy-L-arabinose transferase-like glycosyltransferase